MLTADAFAHTVRTAAERHAIPGINAAVAYGRQTVGAACGVLDIATRRPVSADSVFAVGSITKVFTGTLVMQLVAAGRLDLDAPVSRYLPDLELGGRPIAQEITIRTLLAHTSGILGDCFLDTGEEADATRRYVEQLRALRAIAQPGRFSYCNSGFVILGRLIEVLGGAPWVEQLRANILAPLEIHALTAPSQRPQFDCATGHVLDAGGNVSLSPTPYLPRSTEAAGARLSMSPAALLAFARMHLHDGLAASGVRILSERGARAMRELQVRVPIEFAQIAGYGLAWAIRDPAAGIVGHNGATIGQSAFLLLFPQHDSALAVLTNMTSVRTNAAFEEILAAVTATLPGLQLAPHAGVHEPAADVGAFLGAYATALHRITVRRDATGLHARLVPHARDAIAPPFPVEYRLRPIGAERFEAVDERDGGTAVVGFVAGEGPGSRMLFWGGRLAERCSTL